MSVIHGDCLDVMRGMDAACVDAIVTDPPYGLAFMGKAWDHGVPGVPFWEAALAVAKPGSYLLAFGGTRTYHRLACAIEDAGWEIHDCLSWLYGSGFPKHASKLKPAWEPVVMARKPAPRATPLGVDACRLPTTDNLARPARGIGGVTYAQDAWTKNPENHQASESHPLGRWPANVMLDDEARAALDAQGGVSRLFYCAKASRSEREAGLAMFAARRGASETFDASRRDGIGAERCPTVRNHHPTVKPVALMRWLVRLVTPAGGLVLDPFAGSGTTGIAATLEGRRFVGIEREAAYVEIARARIAAVPPTLEGVA